MGKSFDEDFATWICRGKKYLYFALDIFVQYEGSLDKFLEFLETVEATDILRIEILDTYDGDLVKGINRLWAAFVEKGIGVGCVETPIQRMKDVGECGEGDVGYWSKIIEEFYDWKKFRQLKSLTISNLKPDCKYNWLKVSIPVEEIDIKKASQEYLDSILESDIHPTLVENVKKVSIQFDPYNGDLVLKSNYGIDLQSGLKSKFPSLTHVKYLCSTYESECIDYFYLLHENSDLFINNDLNNDYIVQTNAWVFFIKESTIHSLKVNRLNLNLKEEQSKEFVYSEKFIGWWCFESINFEGISEFGKGDLGEVEQFLEDHGGVDGFEGSVIVFNRDIELYKFPKEMHKLLDADAVNATKFKLAYFWELDPENFRILNEFVTNAKNLKELVLEVSISRVMSKEKLLEILELLKLKIDHLRLNGRMALIRKFDDEIKEKMVEAILNNTGLKSISHEEFLSDTYQIRHIDDSRASTLKLFVENLFHGEGKPELENVLLDFIEFK